MLDLESEVMRGSGSIPTEGNFFSLDFFCFQVVKSLMPILDYYQLCLIKKNSNGCTGTGPGLVQEPNGKYNTVEMFTVVRDRDRDKNLLFPIAPVSFPVPVLVPFQCSVPIP